MTGTDIENTRLNKFRRGKPTQARLVRRKENMITRKQLEEGGPSCIDDPVFMAYHPLALCDIAFPTFRTRCQLNTPRKIITSTSASPGTLVEPSGYMGGNNALKWKGH